MGGGVAVPLEGDLPLAALGAALQLLYLRLEVHVLVEVELLGEAGAREETRGDETRRGGVLVTGCVWGLIQ